MPYSIQKFKSSLPLATQIDNLSGLHFSLSRFYFDEAEYSTPEQETFRFIRLYKNFYFDGVNTASTLETDSGTKDYLQHHQSVDMQVRLTGMFMEQHLHLQESQTLEAEIFGVFDIYTQKNNNSSKTIAPLFHSSNIYILKTQHGVSYHIDICGEFSRSDFFKALQSNSALQSLYEQFCFESEKMELDTQTPRLTLSKENSRPIHKI